MKLKLLQSTEWDISLKNKFWNTFLFKYFLVSFILTSLISFIGYRFSTDFLDFIKPPRPTHERPPRHGPPPHRMKDRPDRPHIEFGIEQSPPNMTRIDGRRGNFKIIGLEPPIFVALAFGVPHLILFILHHLLTVYLFRRAANQTKEVLRELKSGNLKARFPKDGSDNFGTISNEVDEMADELEKLVLNLEKAEIQRKAILQELVHDVRTPITSLKSMIEVLIDHSDTMSKEEAASFLHTSLLEVKYFEKLVNDLLFISELVDQKSRFSLGRVDICEVISGKIDAFKVQDIKISSNVETIGPIYIEGDKQQLKRLFQNALSNAVSFAKQNVEVRMEDGKDIWKITILDDGKGISKERQEVFGEKFRSREVLKEQDDRISIGLGAVIMKKIALAHKGSVSIGNIVEDGEVRGARLEILIPKE